MQNIIDLYKELSQKIVDNMPDIRWVDLWHNQTNLLEDEHPFPTPAVFINFKIKATDDIGEKVQQVQMQIDLYLYYETFSDTYHGSSNQTTALDFLQSINALYALFHASDGENYSQMRRIDLKPVDTGNAGNLYVQSFTCEMMDYGAMKVYEEGSMTDIAISNEAFTIPKQETNGYTID